MKNELINQFIAYLLEQRNVPSKVTIKNYRADVSKLIKWYEQTYQTSFDPTSITPLALNQYKAAKLEEGLSARSLERHFSSFRSFFSFLKLEGYISHSPFETLKSEAKRDEPDPYRIKDFKNFLYVYNASHLTIKNYLIDVKQFLKWVEQVTGVDQAWDVKDKDIFSKINNSLIEEYKRRLLSQSIDGATSFSASTVNRKLSSLRKYLTWAQTEGMIKSFEAIPNIEQREQAKVQFATIEQEKVKKEEKVSSYSPVPPIRLAQKSFRGFNSILESIFINPIVSLTKHGEYMVWKAKGKPVFQTLQTAKEKVKKATTVNPTLITNIPKSFYAPVSVSTKYLPWHRKAYHHMRYTRPNWYVKYHSYTITHYFHFAVLIIVMSALGFGMYRAFFEAPQQQKTLAAVPTSPLRILSFQGRLTDDLDTPITADTNLRFIIYNDVSATAGARLWEELQTVEPDEDGIFSINLGSDGSGGNAALCNGGSPSASPATGACGIPTSLFAENAALWLGISVESTPELEPRQQLATVAYATNAETLQGLPPITAGSDTENVVLALDSSGNLTIGGSASPVFQATGGEFTLSGNIVTITTVAGTDSNIVLAPDNLGQVDIQRPIQNSSLNNNIESAAGAVEIDDLLAVLATSSGQSAFTLNQNGAGPLISASASGIARFTLGNDGSGYFAGSITGSTFALGGVSAKNYNIISDSTLATYANSDDDLYIEDILEVGGTLYVGGVPVVPGSGSSYWNQDAGALFPNNSTVDLLVGSQSSSSAKFAVLNVNSEQPVTSASGNLIVMPRNGWGGNVGIRTTNPLSSLDIRGTSTNSVLRFSRSDENAFDWSYDADNGKLNLDYRTGSGRTLFKNLMSWDYAGNVGIGTTGPDTRLDILSPAGGTQLRLTSTDNSVYTDIKTDQMGYLSITPSGLIATLSGTLNPSVTSSYNLGSTTKYWDTLYVNNIVGTTVSSNEWQRTLGAVIPRNITDDLLLGSTATSSALFSVTGIASNNVSASVAGNLILRKLDASTTVNMYDNLNNLHRIVAVGSELQIQHGLSKGVTFFNDLISGSPYLTLYGFDSGASTKKYGRFSVSGTDGTFRMEAQSGENIALRTGGSDALTILNSGYVGIGVTDPDAALEVNGQVKITGGSPGAGKVLTSDADGLGSWDTIGAASIDDDSLDFVKFEDTLDLDNNLTLNQSTYTWTQNYTGTTADGFTYNANSLTSGTALKLSSTSTGLTTGGLFSLDWSPVSDVFATGDLFSLNIGQYGNIGNIFNVKDDGSSLFSISETAVTSNLPTSFTSAGDVSMAYDLVFTNPSASYIKSAAPLYIQAGEMFNSSDLTLGTYQKGNVIVDSEAFVANQAATVSGRLVVGTSAPDSTQIGGFYLTNSSTFGKALAILNQTESQDIFTASSSGTTVFTIGSDGSGYFAGSITAPTDETINGIDISAGAISDIDSILGNATSMFAFGGIALQNYNAISDSGGSASQASTDNDLYVQDVLEVGGTLYVGGVQVTPGSGSSYWNQNAGALFPNNSTVDLLVGGQSSSSAKFAVLNINSGTPTASVSATATGNGISLGGNGVIQSLRNNTLTIGGNTSGNIALMPLNGSGNVGIGTTNPWATLSVNGAIRTGTDSTNYGGMSWSSGLNINTYNYASPITFNGGSLYISPNSNGNIGIGTTSPAHLLQVEGAPVGKALLGLNYTGTDQNILVASTSGTTQAYLTNAGVFSSRSFYDLDNTGYYLDPASTGTALQTYGGIAVGGSPIPGAAVYVNKNTGGAVAMVVNQLSSAASADLFVASKSGVAQFIVEEDGDIIVGPGGAGKITAAIIDPYLISNDGSVQPYLEFNNAVTEGANDFIFKVGSGEKMRLTEPGNLSIGVDNPSGAFKLEVGGDIGPDQAGRNLGSALKPFETIFANNIVGTGTLGYWQRNNGALYPSNITNDLLLGSNATSSALFSVTGIASNQPIASLSGNMTLMPRNGWGGNLSLYDGRIIQFGTPGTGTAIYDSTGSVDRTAIKVRNNRLDVLTADGNQYSTITASALYGGNNASTDLTLDSSRNATKGDVIIQPSGGNVGIGTSSPDASLNVNGGTGLHVEGARSVFELDNNQIIQSYRPVSSLYAGADYSFAFNNTSGTKYEAAAITANLRGNTLGAENVAMLFNTRNAGTFQTSMWLSQDGKLSLFHDGTQDVDTYWYHPSADTMTWTTAGNEVLRMTSGGFVGIGTTTPRAKLEVAGDASTSGSLVMRGTSPSTIDVLNGNTFQIQTSPGGDAGLTPRLTILKNGYVGIGTTTPQGLLDVGGHLAVLDNDPRISKEQFESLSATVSDRVVVGTGYQDKSNSDINSAAFISRGTVVQVVKPMRKEQQYLWDTGREVTCAGTFNAHLSATGVVDFYFDDQGCAHTYISTQIPNYDPNHFYKLVFRWGFDATGVTGINQDYTFTAHGNSANRAIDVYDLGTTYSETAQGTLVAYTDGTLSLVGSTYTPGTGITIGQEYNARTLSSSIYYDNMIYNKVLTDTEANSRYANMIRDYSLTDTLWYAPMLSKYGKKVSNPVLVNENYEFTDWSAGLPVNWNTEGSAANLSQEDLGGGNSGLGMVVLSSYNRVYYNNQNILKDKFYMISSNIKYTSGTNSYLSYGVINYAQDEHSYSITTSMLPENTFTVFQAGGFNEKSTTYPRIFREYNTAGKWIADYAKIYTFTETDITRKGSVLVINGGINIADKQIVDSSRNLSNIGTASLSGQLTLAGTPTVQSTAFQSLVLGGNTTGNIVVSPLNGAAGGAILPVANGLTDIGSSSLHFRNIYADNFIGGSTGTQGYWQRNNGAISPSNIADDFLLGATSTSSALFSVSGIASNQPIASVSGNFAIMAKNGWGGNLGIGNTSTTIPLYVYREEATGTNRVMAQFQASPANNGGSTILRVGNGSLSTDIEHNASGNGPFRYGAYADTNIVNNYTSAAGPYGNIHFVTNDDIKMTITGGNASGNVGIGTITPKAKLDVIGDASISGSLIASTVKSGTGPLNLQYKSGLNTWGNALTVRDNTGYVGVGTTEPEYQLDVINNSGMRVRGTGAAATELRMYPSTGNQFYMTASSLFITPTNLTLEPSSSLVISAGPTIGHATLSLKTSNAPALYITGSNDNRTIQIASDATSQTNAQLEVVAATTSLKALNLLSRVGGTQLRLSSTNGSVYTDIKTDQMGYLSISPTGEIASFSGTLNPSTDSTYDLGSPTAYWNNLYVNNIYGIGTVSGFWQRNNGALSPVNISDALNVGSTSSSSALFHVPGTNNQDAWFNLGTGNLGIGTNTPGAKLDIVMPLGSNGKIMDLQTENNDIWWRIGHSGDSYGYYWKYDGTGAGNDNTLRLISENQTGTDFDVLKIYQTTGGMEFFGGYSSTGVTIQENGNILTSGNVGIGTDSLNNKLTIQQEAVAGGESVAAMKWTSPNYTLGYLGADATTFNSGALYLYRDGAANTKISANASSYLMGGRVGIGTTGPDVKLDVLSGEGETQLRLTSTDNSKYTDFKTNQLGELSIAPSGNLATLSGALRITEEYYNSHKEYDISTVTTNGTGWYRAASFGGGRGTYEVRIYSRGANAYNETTLLVNVGGYGTGNNITVLQNQRYNATRVEQVRISTDFATSYLDFYLNSAIETLGVYVTRKSTDNGTISLSDLEYNPTEGPTDSITATLLERGHEIQNISSEAGAGGAYFSGRLSVGTYATVSGNLTLAGGARSIQTTANNSLTLGGSTTGNIVVSPLNGAAGGAILPVANGLTDIGSSSLHFRNIYADNFIGGSTGTQGYWQRNNGVLSPVNITDDLLIGGISTSSAKFSISATTGNASSSGTLTVSTIRPPTGALNLQYKSGLNTWSNALTVRDNTGYVGIGTTSPISKLTLGGTSATNGLSFDAASNGTRYAQFYYDASASPENQRGLYIEEYNSAVGTNRGIHFKSGGSERLTILGTGNVGIGTTSPNAKLDVSGAIMLPGSSGNTMTRPEVGTSRITGEISGYSSVASTQDDGFLRLSAGGGTTAGTKSFIDLSGYNQNSDMDRNITFGTSGTEKMRISSTGNVGIGTTSTTNTLTIHGTNSETIPILGLRSGNISTTFNDGAQIAFGYNGTDDYQHFIHTRHNSSNVNNAIDFYVSDGTQNNTVTSGSIHTMSLVSGKVGIGVTDPDAALEVNGQVKITGGSPGANKVLTSDGDGLASWQTIGEASITDDSLDFVKFEDTLDLDNNLTLNQSTYTWTQNYTGTTADGFTYNANSLTSGTAFKLSSTSTGLTTGGLFSLDWSPASDVFATGDLFSLNIGQYGNIGNIFNVKDNSSSLFSISETAVTSNLPTSFTSAGDVSMAYDLVFTNPTASYIKSAAPLYIQAGEMFNSSDLTLGTYQKGNVIVDSEAFVANQAATISGRLVVGSSTPDSTQIGGFYLTNSSTFGKALAILNQTESQDIFTASASGTPKFAIKNNGNTEVYGQVKITGGGPGAGYVLTSDADGLATWSDIGSSGGPWTLSGNNLYPDSTDYNVAVGATDAGTAKLYVNGNVGIGTSSPEYKLDINAGTLRFVNEGGTALRIDGGSGTDTTLLRVDASNDGESDTTDYGFSLKYMGSRSGLQNSLSIFADNQTGTPIEALTMLQDGSIGIGNTNPGAKLEIEGGVIIDNTYTLQIGGGSASGDAVIELGNSAGVGYVQTLTNRDLKIGSDGYPVAMFVEGSNGNVGIGTTSPDYTLDVAGNMSMDEYLYHNGDADTFHRFLDNRIQLTAGNVNFIDIKGTTQDEIAFNESGADIDFRVESNGGNDAFFVEGSSGKIGIGTISPKANLDVEGRTTQFSNLYPVYRWRWGGAQDLNWKKVADVTLSTGAYVSSNFQVNIKNLNTNFGSGVNIYDLKYFVSTRRSCGTQDNCDDAILSGPNTDYVRVVKTATGVFEIQVRQPTDWKHMSVQVQQLSGAGVTVTYADSPADGSTVGTIYTPVVSHTDYLANANVAGTLAVTSTITAAVNETINGIDINNGAVSDIDSILGNSTSKFAFGGIALQDYNAISDSTTATYAQTDNDLYVEDVLEVGNALYVNGVQITGDSMGGSSYWNQALGTLFPNNSTVDLLIGGQSTSSAKFAVFNINNGTPTASVSATSTGTGLSLGGDGVIQSLRNNTLTIGGNTTGSISLVPGNTTTMTLNAAGNVGIGTANPGGKLEISGGNLKMTSGNIVLNTNWLSGDGGNEGIYVDNEGDVGVGTSSPGSYKLSVSGNALLNNLDFANPGIGNGSMVRFLKTSDNAWINVTETASDQTTYGFYMSDNPDSSVDKFLWQIQDHKGDGGDWTPLEFAGLNAKLRATNINAYGDYNIYGPWYSGGGTENTVSEIKTGTLTVTPNVSGFTGTSHRLYTVVIDSEGSPNTFKWCVNSSSTCSSPVQSNVAITGSAQTLDTGVTITFNSTTGGVIGDWYSFRVYKGGHVLASDGLATAPTFSFTSDSNTGIYRIGSDSLGIATGGVNRITFDTSGSITLGAGTNTIANTDSNTAILINPAGTGSVQFHSSSYYINSSGQLTIATDESINGIDINAGAVSDIDSILGNATSRFAFGGIALQNYNAISDSTAATYAQTDNDLYVEDVLEVGGTLYVAGSPIANYWQRSLGSLAPVNITDALNIGAVASASAVFHVPGTTNEDAWFNLGTGNLGIGITDPSAPLSFPNTNGDKILVGDIGSGSGYGISLNSNVMQIAAYSDSQRVGIGHSNTGNYANFIETMTIKGSTVGIGTTSPDHKLHVSGETVGKALVSFNATGTGQNILTASSSGTTQFYLSSTGTVTARSFYDLDDTNYFFDPAATGTSLKTLGSIGIGGDPPTGTALYVNKNTIGKAAIIVNQLSAATGADLIAASVSGTTNFLVKNNGDVVVGPGGTGKLTAVTLDPLYTIDGSRYSTYGTSMIGVKEEIAGKANLTYNSELQAYTYSINLNNQEVASDLWLFSRVIDQDLTLTSVLLTPDSNARVWYQKDVSTRTITFLSDSPTSLSYRLTAPRFDHEKWANISDETDPNITGLIVPDAEDIINEKIQEATAAGSSLFEIAQTTDDQGNIIFVLIDSLGNQIKKTGDFSSLLAANIKVGFADIQNLAAENMTINGQAIADYIASIVANTINSSNLIATGDIVSPSGTFDQIRTDVISPLASDSTVEIALGHNKVEVKNKQTKEVVTSIDDQGNASFAGTLTADNAELNDASVAGTLRVGKLIADNIEGLATESAQYITNNYYVSTPSAEQESTTSGEFIAEVTEDGFVNIASFSGQLAYVENLSANYATFNQGLMSFGPASFADVSVAGQFAVGGNLIIADSSINVLGTDLHIQPLKQGGVNFMAGALTIDENGNLVGAGNATFRGTLFANVISPIQDNDLVIKLDKSELKVKDASGSAVFAVNNKGDVTASGSGTFKKLNLSLTEEAYALSGNEIIATGSAGVATISARQNEITIYNDQVTKDSLIYITPKTNTANQVLFLMRQVPEDIDIKGIDGSFTVGIDSFSSTDIPFNWMIVN